MYGRDATAGGADAMSLAAPVPVPCFCCAAPCHAMPCHAWFSMTSMQVASNPKASKFRKETRKPRLFVRFPEVAPKR